MVSFRPSSTLICSPKRLVRLFINKPSLSAMKTEIGMRNIRWESVYLPSNNGSNEILGSWLAFAKIKKHVTWSCGIKEICVRKVLSASALSHWQLLSKDFAKLILISCVISIPVA